MFKRIYDTKAFTAMHAVNFRIFILGQTVSLVGTWMQRLAMSWLVLRLTGSAAGLGLLDLSNQAPVLITGLFAGSIIDRFDMKKILMATQVLCMVQAFVIAFLDFSGTIRYTQLLVLSIMLGIVTSIDFPARQSCVPRMLDSHSQLNSALTINSVIFNMARLIGPTVAGFALQSVGEATCFLLNGFSFMASIYSITKLKIKDAPPVKHQNGWKSFREGLEYTLRFKALRKILFSSSAFFFLCYPFSNLLPYFAKNIFQNGASTLGLFLGAVGLGAIIGVVYQASFVPVTRLHVRAVYSVGMFGFALAVFACSRSVPFSCAALTLLGFGMSTGSVCFNTLVQSIIEESKRGRVMSIYTIGSMGFGPLGSLMAGIIADIFGGTFSGLLFGIGSILLAFYMRRDLKHIEPPVLSILLEKGFHFAE